MLIVSLYSTSSITAHYSKTVAISTRGNRIISHVSLLVLSRLLQICLDIRLRFRTRLEPLWKQEVFLAPLTDTLREVLDMVEVRNPVLTSRQRCISAVKSILETYSSPENQL